MKTKKSRAAKKTKAPSKISMKVILVPVDFSKPSEKALEYAVHMARTLNCELRLLHVIESTSVATESLQWVDFFNQVRAVVAPMLKNLKEKLEKRGITVKTEVIRGSAYHEIAKQARRHKADLIVMGTQGRTGIERLFLGSVAERVVRLAPCPVLTVHP